MTLPRTRAARLAFIVWIVALHAYWIQHLTQTPLIDKGLHQCRRFIGR